MVGVVPLGSPVISEQPAQEDPSTLPTGSIGERFSSAWETGPFPQSTQWLGKEYGKAFGPTEPDMSPDDIKKAFGIEVKAPMSYYDAAFMAQRQGAKEQEQLAFNNGGTAANFAIHSAAFFADPINAATALIPPLGEARIAAGLTKAGVEVAGNVAARVGVRSAAGAAGFAAGQVPIAAIDYGLDKQAGIEHSIADSLREVLYAGVMGAVFHPLFGAIGDAWKGEVPVWAREKYSEKADAVQTALSQVMNERPVDVPPPTEPPSGGGGGGSVQRGLGETETPLTAAHEVAPAEQPVAAPATETKLGTTAEAKPGATAESKPPTVTQEVKPAVKTEWAQGTETKTDANQTAIPEPKLPRDLSGAKPRYRDSTLSFESDIDRAAYTTGQSMPNKRDADFRAFLKKAGLSDADILARNKAVRAKAAELYNAAPGEHVHIESLSPKRFAARAPEKAPERPPAPATTPQEFARTQNTLAKEGTSFGSTQEELKTTKQAAETAAKTKPPKAAQELAETTQKAEDLEAVLKAAHGVVEAPKVEGAAKAPETPTENLPPELQEKLKKANEHKDLGDALKSSYDALKNCMLG